MKSLESIGKYQGSISLTFAILIVLLPKLSQLLAIITILFIALLLLLKYFKPRIISINDGKTKIIIEYGDLLENKESILVIPVDREFNTIVDDNIISNGSIHGQFINKILENKTEDLIKTIARELGAEPYDNRFAKCPPGTIVPIDHNGTEYYLLALSELDSEHKAQCTPEEYAQAIFSLIKYTDIHFNDRTIFMPLIGSGLSNVFKSMNDEDALQILISLIKINQCSRIREIHIVIKEKKNNSRIRTK